MSETFLKWKTRAVKARKHGRKIKPLGEFKFEILSEIFENKNLSQWDKLEMAFNYGYVKGQFSIPDPLYNQRGEQIREVTQNELEWTR